MPKHLELKGWTRTVRRGTVVVGLPWHKIVTVLSVIALIVLVLSMSGCSCTGLNKQSLDQVDAAIQSAEGFKARAAKGEAVPEVLVDIHLENLNGLKANLERAVSDE
jgi:uncharacterized membrane protein